MVRGISGAVPIEGLRPIIRPRAEDAGVDVRLPRKPVRRRNLLPPRSRLSQIPRNHRWRRLLNPLLPPSEMTLTIMVLEAHGSQTYSLEEDCASTLDFARSRTIASQHRSSSFLFPYRLRLCHQRPGGDGCRHGERQKILRSELDKYYKNQTSGARRSNLPASRLTVCVSAS